MPEEITYMFSDAEISALLLGLNYALDGAEASLKAYTQAGDSELVNEERDLIATIKSLYKRFLPNVPEEEWKWEGGEG